MDPITAVSNNTYLVIGVTVGLVWVIQKAIALRKEAKSFVAHVVEEKMPEAIKASLKNGIQELVDRKNAEQETRMVKYIDECFHKHETREEAHLEKLIAELRESNSKRRR